MIRLFLITFLVSAVIPDISNNTKEGQNAPRRTNFNAPFGRPQPTYLLWKAMGAGAPAARRAKQVNSTQGPLGSPLGNTTLAGPLLQTTVPTLPTTFQTQPTPGAQSTPTTAPGTQSTFATTPGAQFTQTTASGAQFTQTTASGAQSSPTTAPSAVNPTSQLTQVTPGSGNTTQFVNSSSTSQATGAIQGAGATVRDHDEDVWDWNASNGSEYIVKNKDSDGWVYMVGNDKQVYMVHPVQSKQDKYDYDPWTIGQVLGFLHEWAEFDGKAPPGGWTIDLINGSPATPKRHLRSVRNRRGVSLIFTRKSAESEQNYRDGVA